MQTSPHARTGHRRPVAIPRLNGKTTHHPTLTSPPKTARGRICLGPLGLPRLVELPYRYTEDSGVRVTQCESWDDFIQALRVTNNKPLAQRAYRGHADPCWKLSSAWERLIDHHKHERRIIGDWPGFSPQELYELNISDKQADDNWLISFKQLVSTMPQMPDHTHWTKEDWWAFGRHFGLNTPLLDWSRSPFIVAFWAFIGRVFSENIQPETKPLAFYSLQSTKPVVIWELSLLEGLAVPGEFGAINNVRYELHRQRAQSGVFTLLHHDKYTDLESYLSWKGYGKCLERYEIPCSSVKDVSIVLSDLDRMNINYGTVFPDPEGAARQANLQQYWFEMMRLASDESPSWDSPLPDGK